VRQFEGIGRVRSDAGLGVLLLARDALGQVAARTARQVDRFAGRRGGGGLILCSGNSSCAVARPHSASTPNQ
jgi:hypothetical protein